MNFKDIKKDLTIFFKRGLSFFKLFKYLWFFSVLFLFISGLIILLLKNIKITLIFSILSVLLLTLLFSLSHFIKLNHRKLAQKVGSFEESFNKQNRLLFLFNKEGKNDYEKYLFLSKKGMFTYNYLKFDKEVNTTQYNDFLHEYFNNAPDPYAIIKSSSIIDYSNLKSEFLKIEKINDFENKIIFSKHNLVYYDFISWLTEQDDIQMIKTNDIVLKDMILLKISKIKNVSLENVLEWQTV